MIFCSCFKLEIYKKPSEPHNRIHYRLPLSSCGLLLTTKPLLPGFLQHILYICFEMINNSRYILKCCPLFERTKWKNRPPVSSSGSWWAERRGWEWGSATASNSSAAFYLDSLPFDLHHLLPEIHADGSLGLIGEAAPREAEGEAGLPHVGVPDDDDLKDPRLDAQLQGGGAQIHGGCDARGGIVAAAGSAPAGSV